MAANGGVHGSGRALELRDLPRRPAGPGGRGGAGRAGLPVSSRRRPAVVGTGTSLALSSLLSLLLFAGMQMYSRQLASTEWLTIQGGLLGSGLFVFSLTVSSCGGAGRGGLGGFGGRRVAGHAGLCHPHFSQRLLPALLLNSRNPGL